MNVRLWLALLVVAGSSALFARLVFTRARALCRTRGFLRPMLVAGAVALLGAVAWSVPRIGELAPPYSESPAGLFVIAGRLLVVFFGSVAALATLAATLTPARS